MKIIALLVVLQIAGAFCAFASISGNENNPIDQVADRSEFNRALPFSLHWANLGQFPYHVAITSESTISGEVTLGSGSLISPLWVLTSARCVFRSQVYRLRFSSVTYYTGGFEQVSTEAYVHPHYNPNNNTNDAALIRVQPVGNIASGVVRLFSHQQYNANLINHVVILTSWGQPNGYQSKYSPVLQYGFGQLLDNRNCPNATRTNISCAAIFNQYSRNCVGDTGAPLVIQVNRTVVQVGINILGANDGFCFNSTNLYTNVLNVREWITRVSGVNF